ncbi:MAG: DUF1273 family protein [Oscillospiraceae bacterium]|nr:DUF1273 family protein [Oscillospiraceae bacterium]
MSVVTFCGHADFYGAEDVKAWLKETVEGLIRDGADDFLLGGYGGFDACAASVVWELKKQYPAIRSTLVLPYLDRKVDATKYDATLYPSLEKVPRRFAISKRNEYMVNEADIVVAYVTHDWGGAATTLAYAKRKKKEIINYGNI